MKRSLTLLFGLSVGSFAQEPEPPAPGTRPVPRPASRPGVPNPLPGVLPTLPTEPEAAVVDETRARLVDPNRLAVPASGSINKANITALAAAQLYEDHSGKRVIMSNAVAQSEVSFTMRGPLTNGDIAKFVKLTLLGEGLAMIPIPGEPGIVRLVPSGVLTSPSQVPKEVYSDEFSLPSDDQLVVYQMVLRYLKPEDALRVIQSSVGALSPSGNISAVPNASSLMITENSSLIRQMIKIQKLIDIPNPVGEKWVTVTYGDVDEIAERMNEIYNEQSNNRQATRTTRTNAPPNPGNAAGAASGEEIPLRIIGVRRTSRILLVGRPTDLVAAEAMVRSFDQPSTDNTRQTFRLRYLRVGDFMTIAENAISATLGDGAEGQAGGRALPNQNNNNNNNNNTTGNQGDTGNRASIQEQDIPTAPESLLVGRTLLVGDNVANTIIVNGPPHHIEIVRDLIADLDSESQQIALSAVVGSYAINDGQNFGIDLASAISQSGSDFTIGGATQFGNGFIDPASLADLGNILTATGVAGSGVSIYGALNDDFGFFVNALETNSKFKTLERTVLTTRNNRVAELSSGQRIAIPTSTFNSGTTGTSTNIEFRDVTLELQIQPLINSDDQVTLEISLVRDSLGAERLIDGTLSIPDINTDQLTTSITVRDGSAVILGGIITTTDQKTKSGVPILSSLPGVGSLFRRKESTATESELVIMIQPRILQSQDSFNQFGNDYSESSKSLEEVRGQFIPRGGRGVLPPNGTLRQEPEAKPVLKKSTWGSSSSSKKPKSKIRSKTGRPGR